MQLNYESSALIAKILNESNCGQMAFNVANSYTAYPPMMLGPVQTTNNQMTGTVINKGDLRTIITYTIDGTNVRDEGKFVINITGISGGTLQPSGIRILIFVTLSSVTSAKTQMFQIGDHQIWDHVANPDGEPLVSYMGVEIVAALPDFKDDTQASVRFIARYLAEPTPFFDEIRDIDAIGFSVPPPLVDMALIYYDARTRVPADRDSVLHLHDLSSNKKHGVFVGNTGFDALTKRYVFDGGNDGRITIDNIGNSGGNWRHSIAVWIKFDQLVGRHNVFSIGQTTSTGGTGKRFSALEITRDGGSSEYYLKFVHGQNNHQVNPSLINNRWYHLCYTIVSSVSSVYIDGSLVSTTKLNDNVIQSNSRIHISGVDWDSSSTGIFGSLGHLSVYDGITLDVNQITELYNHHAIAYASDEVLTSFEVKFGKGWRMIKELAGNSTSWYPNNDNLKGDYGTYTEFLFTHGDFSKWLITDKSQVHLTSTTMSEGQLRLINSSSKQDTPYQVKWFNRFNGSSGYWIDYDPWISIEDHPVGIVYGEGSTTFNGSHIGASGMFVYVR